MAEAVILSSQEKRDKSGMEDMQCLPKAVPQSWPDDSNRTRITAKVPNLGYGFDYEVHFGILLRKKLQVNNLKDLLTNSLMHVLYDIGPTSINGFENEVLLLHSQCLISVVLGVSHGV